MSLLSFEQSDWIIATIFLKVLVKIWKVLAVLCRIKSFRRDSPAEGVCKLCAGASVQLWLSKGRLEYDTLSPRSSKK